MRWLPDLDQACWEAWKAKISKCFDNGDNVSKLAEKLDACMTCLAGQGFLKSCGPDSRRQPADRTTSPCQRDSHGAEVHGPSASSLPPGTWVYGGESHSRPSASTLPPGTWVYGGESHSRQSTSTSFRNRPLAADRTPSPCQRDSDGAEVHVPSASLLPAETLLYGGVSPSSQKTTKGIQNRRLPHCRDCSMSCGEPGHKALGAA